MDALFIAGMLGSAAWIVAGLFVLFGSGSLVLLLALGVFPLLVPVSLRCNERFGRGRLERWMPRDEGPGRLLTHVEPGREEVTVRILEHTRHRTLEDGQYEIVSERYARTVVADDEDGLAELVERATDLVASENAERASAEYGHEHVERLARQARESNVRFR